MSNPTFSKETSLAIHAAQEAGKLLLKGFQTDFQIKSKEGRHNLVTEYDYLSEKKIISILKEGTPEASFLAEESGMEGSFQDLLWIIDPLDGTVNFAHQIPIFSISIALQVKGHMQLGVVYSPLHNELFVAEKNKGAFLNNKPIHVSRNENVKEAMIATGFPYNLEEDPFHCIEHFMEIIKIGMPIRRLGSAALDLAYTACGRFEGFFEVGLSPWDVAAGNLLVEEAGGLITNWSGNPYQLHIKEPLFASNQKIHSSILPSLQKRIR